MEKRIMSGSRDSNEAGKEEEEENRSTQVLLANLASYDKMLSKC